MSGDPHPVFHTYGGDSRAGSQSGRLDNKGPK